MAITAALCNSYKQEILEGTHVVTDTYMLALYTSLATLSKATTAYTATNEVPNGSGYLTGGAVLSGFTTSLDDDVAILDFDDAEWETATITAAGALIYNATRANRAVAVVSFGGDVSSTSGPFTVSFPEPTATTGLIRLEAPA